LTLLHQICYKQRYMLHAPINIEHSEQLRRELRSSAPATRNMPRETLGDALLRLAKLGKDLKVTGPTGLSSRIDDYLYGGK
jgi:hypothetical protein